MKVEYRVWNPFRSKIAAGILGGERFSGYVCPAWFPLSTQEPLLTLRLPAPGLDNVYIKPGTKLLYLGGASGTTVSHCSDIVGPTGALPSRCFPSLLTHVAAHSRALPPLTTSLPLSHHVPTTLLSPLSLHPTHHQGWCTRLSSATGAGATW